MRDCLYNGREFFKCSLDYAVGILREVLAELENGGVGKMQCPPTESISFRDLDAGSKQIVSMAAEASTNGCVRLLFVKWIDGLREDR